MAKCDLPFDRRDNLLQGPSAWEMFLQQAGVPESHCASLLARRTRKARAIRSWVRENYSRKYVPEYILSAVGLRKQLRLRWQDED
jgi:hypothetical protein